MHDPVDRARRRPRLLAGLLLSLLFTACEPESRVREDANARPDVQGAAYRNPGDDRWAGSMTTPPLAMVATR